MTSGQEGDLRIILLGKTGAGKSATGNTILGRNAFKETSEICEKQELYVDGKNIVVFDTPGLFNASITKEQVMAEIERCVDMSAPGPHVFLLVIKLGVRFTEEERNSVQWIQENFGKEALLRTIILFTHTDLLRGKSLEEYIRDSCYLPKIVESCSGRYHSFNNKDRNNQHQITELLQKINALRRANGMRHYTPEMFRTIQTEIIGKGEMKPLNFTHILTVIIAIGVIFLGTQYWNNRLQNEEKKLKNIILQMKNELSENEQREQNLKLDLQQKEQEEQTLKEKLQNMEQEEKKLINELSQKAEDEKVLNNKIHEKKQEEKKLINELSQKAEDEKVLNNKIHEKKQEEKKLINELSQKAEDEKVLNNKIQDKEQQEKQLRSEHPQKEQEDVWLKNEIQPEEKHQLIKELLQREQEKSQLKKDLLQKEQETHQLKTDLLHKEKEKHKLKKELQQEEDEQLRMKNERLENKQKQHQLKKKLEQKEQEKQELKKDLQKNEQENQKLKKDLQQKENEKDQLEKKLKSVI